jgi:hypothetical protein
MTYVPFVLIQFNRGKLCHKLVQCTGDGTRVSAGKFTQPRDRQSAKASEVKFEQHLEVDPDQEKHILEKAPSKRRNLILHTY